MERFKIYIANFIQIYSYRIIFRVFLTGSILFLAGCSDFLDEVPDNRVSLNNLEKASQLLTNAFSDAIYAFTDWMKDNVAYTRGVNLRTSLI